MKSPLSSYFIENIEANLNRVDAHIVQAYAESVVDKNIKRKFLKMIIEEYNRTKSFLDKLVPR